MGRTVPAHGKKIVSSTTELVAGIGPLTSTTTLAWTAERRNPTVNEDSVVTAGNNARRTATAEACVKRYPRELAGTRTTNPVETANAGVGPRLAPTRINPTLTTHALGSATETGLIRTP